MPSKRSTAGGKPLEVDGRTAGAPRRRPRARRARGIVVANAGSEPAGTRMERVAEVGADRPLAHVGSRRAAARARRLRAARAASAAVPGAPEAVTMTVSCSIACRLGEVDAVCPEELAPGCGDRRRGTTPSSRACSPPRRPRSRGGSGAGAIRTHPFASASCGQPLPPLLVRVGAVVVGVKPGRRHHVALILQRRAHVLRARGCARRRAARSARRA